MPELPEVETVRRGLEPAMVGASFRKVEQNRPDLRFPLPDRFATQLEGRRVVGLGRRAKYLLADLDDANVLVMHLGMSGSFRIETRGSSRKPGKFHHPRSAASAHNHIVFDMTSGIQAARALDRRLNGDEEFAAGYAPDVSRHMAAYLDQRRRLYRYEQRWPDRPFWSRQHDLRLGARAAA